MKELWITNAHPPAPRPYHIIPHATFYTQEIHELKSTAIQGSDEARDSYQEWFNRAVEMLPSIYHYSWFDLERKIRTYRDYWSQHWQSLYNIPQEDTAENNMFFDKPWSPLLILINFFLAFGNIFKIFFENINGTISSLKP